ncbi:hypothetical protein BVC80_8585g2 [Macleaya cordata]|uniref:PAP/25A-associated n=1 Tax=Macleaya cordata TaxID=56857 RepID=A0A200RAA7_MACCD|nr:hypothetical protein BVC80_8585g2 [Macleaya cordata]
MGDLQNWPQSPNGNSIEDHLFPPPSLSSPANPDPVSIDAECWLRGEKTIREIICQIQPTVVSEQRRKVVIEYVQRLIRGCLGSEVFPFGSVPLKTYLPDGDIDLTALSFQNVEDALASDVRFVLEGEEQNKAAEFEVKDVQYIHAEVKLVKCLVQNIVVDISFNQIGGLCTLCFLEQVDRLIGNDHLFKRSIILIKAWCYYESRILGAHHGLISTYALETLVLYIFHLFHSSLSGPLAVLYRFLDYYSKFDWDNYCISLNGPVCVTSLPEIVAETPENGGGNLLLDKEFLRNCVDMFSVPSKGLETNLRAFPQKHLNIVDPLKENNNLGRSVSKGNFYRIRSAFTYGARKLGRILLLPGESVQDELIKFFTNTLERHGSGQRPDVQDPVPTFGAYGPDPASSKSSSEKCDKAASASLATDLSRTEGESMVDLHGSLSNGIKDIKIAGMERNPVIGVSTSKVGSSQAVLEMDDFVNGNAVSGFRLVGDAKDLATSRTHGPRTKKEATKSTSPSIESDSSSLGRAYDAPHLFFSKSFSEYGKIGSGDQDQTNAANSGTVENKVSSILPRLREQQNSVVLQQVADETNTTIYSCYDHEGSKTSGATDDLLISEDLCNGHREVVSAETDGNPGAPSSLSDLIGDYDSHFKSLLYAQWCHEYGVWGAVVPLPQPSPLQFRNKHGWDTVHRSMPLKRNMLPHMNANGVVSGPQFYSANSPMIPGAAFGAEEMPKPRGTGTYFPNTNSRSYRDRSFPGKGRNPAPANHGHLQRSPRENGWAATLPEVNLIEKGSIHEHPQRHLSALPGRGKPGPLDVFQNGRPVVRGIIPQSNGFALPEKLEFGTFGHRVALSTPSPEVSRQPASSSPQTPVSTPSLQRLRPSLTIDTEKVSVESYHMKDDDFPPLSV